ncbi:MAG: ABC transporter permease [Candidatus Acidiferrales bacterium]
MLLQRSVHILRSWCRSLFSRRALDRDLDDEIKSHLDLTTDENIAKGMTGDEARRAARIELGGIEQVKERVRSVRTGAWLDMLVQDLRFGLRVLRKNPGFTIVTVLTLALGIGANTAIFSVVNAVLLKPLHAPEPNRVVIFMDSTKQGSGPFAADIEFNLWRKETTVFEEVSGYRSASYYLTGVAQPQKVDATLVTEDYFRLFGLSIAHGRGFTSDEELSNGRLLDNGRAVVLSDGFWRTAFGGDAHILGKVISLSGNPYEVVGIMAPHVRTETPEEPDVWLPFPMSPNSSNQVHYFQAVGRLKAGVTLGMANSQLRLMTQEFRREYPNTVSAKRGDVYSVEGMRDAIVRNVRMSLLALAAAVGFVLLIACANAASLLLARAASRTREMAIRTALGATRGRIIRQLLTESILLSTAGALLGMGIGLAGVRILLHLVPSSIPRIGANGSNVTMDWRVLSFTIVIALITGLLFGLIPGLSASRTDPNRGLTQKGDRAGARLAQSKTRSLLVITEMSLALVLLLVAILFTRTLVALRSVNPGFDAHNVVTTKTPLDPKLLKSSGVDQMAQNTFQLLDNLPGVESAAFTTLLPLDGDFNSLPVDIAHRPVDGKPQGFGRRTFISPSYFSVLRIPLLRGRVFTDADRLGSPPVAIINQTMARQLWPDGDALGAQVIIGKGLGPSLEEPPRQIVGIVGDVRDNGLGLPPQPSVFVPGAQRADALWANGTVAWVIRTQAQSQPLNTAIQSVLRQTTGLPIPPLRSMEEVIAQSTGSQSFNMLLMLIFGGAALLLAAIGIYGVTAYLVVQRTHEIGIRMALGAERSDVLRMVLSTGAKLALIGIGIGIGVGFGLTRFLSSMLFGILPTDLMTFTLAPLGLFAITLLACWIPARRAMRVDPMVALRYE